MITLDTNVLLAAFEDNRQKRRAQRVLFGEEQVGVSDWTMTEAAAVLSQQVREREVAKDAAERTLSGIDKWIVDVPRLDVIASDLRTAERLLRGFDVALRAPDALHAAIALRLDAKLATFDTRLANVAERLGIKVVWP